LNSAGYFALAFLRSAQYFFIRRLTSRLWAADIGLRRLTAPADEEGAADAPPRRSPGNAR